MSEQRALLAIRTCLVLDEFQALVAVIPKAGVAGQERHVVGDSMCQAIVVSCLLPLLVSVIAELRPQFGVSHFVDDAFVGFQPRISSRNPPLVGFNCNHSCFHNLFLCFSACKDTTFFLYKKDVWWVLFLFML